ncbi:MAG: ferrous iron transport protein B, partial [Clostridia bacterium]|nr:ferrous iron transport protein B [Clostridia bacterium]
MGLTHQSVGQSALKTERTKQKPADITVTLAGNPNVGKSTVFNELTGMNQHTGNWTGKTVATASGSFQYHHKTVRMVDIPGCYSICAHSPEEEVARDFICFGSSDKTVIVCDGTCLERNLALALQIAEMTKGCIVCINLMDEAKRRGISVNANALSESLKIPVVLTAARSKKGLDALKEEITADRKSDWLSLPYPDFLEEAIKIMTPFVQPYCEKYAINPRWLAVQLIDRNASFENSAKTYLGENFFEDENIKQGLYEVKQYFDINGIRSIQVADAVSKNSIQHSEKLCRQIVVKKTKAKSKRKIDRILTGKYTAFPMMLILLLLLFWITLSGANVPSEYLQKALFHLEKPLYSFLSNLKIPTVCCDLIVFGVYRVLAWVISVMLPPMAIFFPLFTLMEDIGLLPRIAFNLDRAFSGCNACGKQSLTMCMGFGCNAAGVVGCRIIDSPRERLIALMTNAFVPCNGRFPILISITSLFLITGLANGQKEIFCAFCLALMIVFSFFMTLVASKILSSTVLKGVPSSFILEMPPYRSPQFLKILIRSFFDRTIFVLARSVVVAIPAGIIIWILANCQYNGISCLQYLTDFFDPFGRFFGLDGVIITAFILGFPANEIVIPIMLMAYSSGTVLSQITS